MSAYTSGTSTHTTPSPTPGEEATLEIEEEEVEVEEEEEEGDGEREGAARVFSNRRNAMTISFMMEMRCTLSASERMGRRVSRMKDMREKRKDEGDSSTTTLPDNILTSGETSDVS